MPIFSHRLKQLRISHELTQKELADKLNVSQNAIYNWENGKREPDFETLEFIADIFNVDMDYLLGRADKTVRIVNPMTIAANFAGDEYTAEELNKIREFAEFVKSQRKTDIPQLNAAHAIEDASADDKAFDEDIMDDENF